MNILEIKKLKRNKNGSYTLFLENGEELTAYEEVILKYELLLSKKIDAQKRQAILHENAIWDTYYQGLKAIKVKPRTKKELGEDLKKKGYTEENVAFTLQKLEEQKYLDNQRYADSYVHNQILTTSWGPLKIRNALLQKGVEEQMIMDALQQYEQSTEQEKIKKKIAHMIKANHTKSTSFLKQKIKQACIHDGYHLELIQEEIEKASFEEDKTLKEKEYLKLKNRLSRKYQGEELERQIKMKLYQKGFTE